jgi:hypothetical protein
MSNPLHPANPSSVDEHIFAPGFRGTLMEEIVEATIDALRSVSHVRLFRSERGYQGRLFYALQAALDDHGILNDELILEMEYQKSPARHQIGQRPDIILHIPTETSGAAVYENNLAVWALKRRASEGEARDDFAKLNEMFERLRYPLGFFINIDSESHHLDCYTGHYADRILAFAVRLIDQNVSLRQAQWIDDQIIELELGEAISE